jgi:hypothetical protein
MNFPLKAAGIFAALATALCLLTPVPPASAADPFLAGAYLWTQAYDPDLRGSAGDGNGDWAAYKTWLGAPKLAVESDPGWGTGDWYNCCQHVNWNAPWGTMQQRQGAALPVVVLGMGQMPWDPNGNDSWDQKLAWENKTWQREADNDPETMAYFASFAQELDKGSGGFGAFHSVVIRLGYEFDGGWNPFGNLNVMSKMPGNYIAAWRSIVKTMRANDPKHVIKGFCWNPTDGNVQIDQFAYYPGDEYVDYIGFDEYDFGYNGDYKVGTVQPTQAQQDAAWKDMELPRINRFADLSRAHGNKPIVVGEWGLWQLNDKSHPSGGDNPSYIRRMHEWMADPKNHVYLEVYFETPSDGVSQLWPGGKNGGWRHGTTFPKSAALYRTLFGKAGSVKKPVTKKRTRPSGRVTANNTR